MDPLTNYDFPENLKLADITPVHKKKDPTSVENYWPVSNRNSFQILLMNFCLHIYMARKGFNTKYDVLSLFEKWKRTLYTGAVLMDLSKASDTINNQLLIIKLFP